MAFIEGTDRFQSQLFDFFAFDNLISEDNYVRVIDAFCKNNSSALKNVFKQFSNVCRSLELFDFKIFAFDGTKIKANCSKKHAFTIDNLNKALDIEEKIAEYISKIDDDTSSLDDMKKADFQKKLALIKQRKLEYLNLKQKNVLNLLMVVLSNVTLKKTSF